MVLKRKTKKRIFTALMLLIPVVHFIIFWGVVNFNSILMAFQRLNPFTGEYYFTLENFVSLRRFFERGDLVTALSNTFYTFGFLTVFMLPWGFFLTFFLYKKIALNAFWRVTLFIPTMIPAIAMAGFFTYLIHYDGPAGKLWELVFKVKPHLLVKPESAMHTVIFYIFWTNFGGQFILYSGAMARIPKEVVESAQLDGAGMKTELFRITLPLCWPTISMLLLLNLAAFFTVSGPLLFLTGGASNTMTISFWIFSNVNGMPAELNEPAALGILCTLITFPAVLLARRWLSKVYADVEF